MFHVQCLSMYYECLVLIKMFNSPKCCSKSRRPSQSKRRREEIIIDSAHRREKIIVMIKNIVGVEEGAERIARSEEGSESLSRVDVEVESEVAGIVCCSI